MRTQNIIEKALTHTRQNDTKILTKNNSKQEEEEEEVKSESDRIKKNASELLRTKLK